MGPKLAVVGAAGRMGKRIIALDFEAKKFELAGAIESGGHSDIGKDAGILAGIGETGVLIAGVFPSDIDVVIDFSLPEAAEATIDNCIKNNAALVMGTTGLGEAAQKKIRKAGEKIPVIYGTNMSVGMNVLFSLVSKAASMLGDDYDIEIIEQHHRFKKDAPSGSALTLAENICNETAREFPDCLVHGRSGKDCPRQKGTIGMHAIRAGDITGEHSVIYSTLGEKVVLSHSASNRDNFARGALRAAKWLIGKGPGMYSMRDVLGLD